MKVRTKLHKEQRCNYSTESILRSLHKAMFAFERYDTCSYCFLVKKEKPDTPSLKDSQFTQTLVRLHTQHCILHKQHSP